MRPGRLDRGRAGQVQAGWRDAIRSDAAGWSFRGQRGVASDKPGGSLSAESGSGAPDRAPGGVVRRGRKLPEGSFGW